MENQFTTTPLSSQEQIPGGQTSGEQKSAGNAGLSGLLKHIVDVLLLKAGPRISRGEFILAQSFLVIFSFVVTALLAILSPLDGVFGMQIIGLIVFIRWIILYVKRFHDLNKSGGYVFSIIFGAGVGAGFIAFGGIGALFGGSGVAVVVMLLGVAILIELLYYTCICLFKKGTVGENKYGQDSLPRQQNFPDKLYRILGIICVGISIIIQVIT